MSSGERDSLNLGFPYLLCYMSVCCNISVMAGQNTMKLWLGMWLTADQKSAFNWDGLWGKARSKIRQAKKCMYSIKKVTTKPHCIIWCLRLMPNVKHKHNNFQRKLIWPLAEGKVHGALFGAPITCLFTPGVKSHADSNYDVRTDVPDPQTRQPLIKE